MAEKTKSKRFLEGDNAGRVNVSFSRAVDSLCLVLDKEIIEKLQEVVRNAIDGVTVGEDSVPEKDATAFLDEELSKATRKFLLFLVDRLIENPDKEEREKLVRKTRKVVDDAIRMITIGFGQRIIKSKKNNRA